MDVEITDDLFHVCLLASLGSLEKTCHATGASRTTQTHQSGLLREGFPYSWFGGDNEGWCHEKPALSWMWILLMTYSMCLLVSLGSLEKTYHITGANRTIHTHQSESLRGERVSFPLYSSLGVS